jgi:predicted GH43/DUF377 family glycosyl hydrolase
MLAAIYWLKASRGFKERTNAAPQTSKEIPLDYQYQCKICILISPQLHHWGNHMYLFLKFLLDALDATTVSWIPCIYV